MTNTTPKDLRNAFGNFATGITVITSIDTKGKPQGITINSFSTVSLDPPLISWCIDREATLFNLFQQAEHFAVNILSIDQKPISELFASSSLDKFSKQSWSSGIKSLPLLNNCACQLLCSTEHRYPGGDHMILVGRVIQTKNNGSSPLIYHGGKYKQLK